MLKKLDVKIKEIFEEQRIPLSDELRASITDLVMEERVLEQNEVLSAAVRLFAEVTAKEPKVEEPEIKRRKAILD